MTLDADIKKLERHYVPQDFKLTDWASLEPYFKELVERPINSRADLEKWLKDMSEVEAVVSEDACWRQIKMTCDTTDKSLKNPSTFSVWKFNLSLQPYADQLNRKLVECPFIQELDQQQYFTYLRSVKKSIDLYREANIPIQAELSVMQQQYGAIAGKMTIEVNGQEYTLQQASKFLESHDRTLREEVYRKINERRLQDKDELNNLYTNLLVAVIKLL